MIVDIKAFSNMRKTRPTIPARVINVPFLHLLHHRRTRYLQSLVWETYDSVGLKFESQQKADNATNTIHLILTLIDVSALYWRSRGWTAGWGAGLNLVLNWYPTMGRDWDESAFTWLSTTPFTVCNKRRYTEQKGTIIFLLPNLTFW